MGFVSGVETMAEGEIKKALVRQAVEALQGKFAAAGNAGVEVLVTLGSSGSMHFGSDWTNKGEEDASGFLPHECYMGRFALATENGRPKDTTRRGGPRRQGRWRSKWKARCPPCPHVPPSRPV